MRPGENQAVLAAGDRRPGEDDDVEDLAEDQRGDGEINVAQPRGEIGDEQRRAGGAGKPEQDGEPQIGRAERDQRAAAAPYMPSPKKAEWPNETMPV